MPRHFFQRQLREIQAILRIGVIFLGLIGLAIPFLAAAEARGQGLAETSVTVPEKLVSLKALFGIIEAQTAYRFVYNEKDISRIGEVSFQEGKLSVQDLLNKALTRNGIDFRAVGNTVIVKKAAKTRVDPDLERVSTRDGSDMQELVSGTVIDKSGKPLEGVSIRSEDGRFSTTTDKSGYYRFHAPRTADRLVFSSIGFATASLPIPSNGTLNVVLEEQSSSLDEVVVVGYGQQAKRDFIGSVARVSGNQLKDIPVQSFEQALVGKAAGVSVALPNGQLNSPPVIRIRGVNSISLSSYPLIVVDGIPVSTGELSSTHAANNPLGDINPADIESVDVLKDAASTSIYGSRAAGGVILVTTRQGKAGRATTNYDGWIGATQAVRIPKVLNAQQYTDIKNEAIANATQLDGVARNPAYFLSHRADGSVVDTDWREYVYHTGLSHNHSLNVSGGSDQVNYYFSANTSNQQGFLVGNDFGRNGIRFNIDNRVTSWLTIAGRASYNVSKNRSFDSGSLPGSSMTTTGATRLSLVLPPNVSAYNEDGSFNLNPNSGTLGSGKNTGTIPLFNPVSLFALTRDVSRNNHFIGNVSATIRPIDGVELTSLYAVDRVNAEDEAYRSPLLGSPSFNSGGSATNTSRLRTHETWTNTLRYAQGFDSHKLSVLVGVDIQQNKVASWGASATQASDDFFEYYQGGWGNVTASGNSRSDLVYASFFTRLNYDYKNRYYLTGNFRRDGNSALAVGSKYGNFGGAAIGWLISDEPFFKEAGLQRIVDDLKLNASWGRVGNGNLSAYSSYDLYSASLYGTVPTWSINQQGNPDLRWETSDQTNIGASFATFDRRVHVEVAYFQNDVNNLILNTPQSPSKGIPGNTILANVGSMYNKGIELGISGEVIADRSFRWNVAVNLTAIRNKVTALADGNADIIGSTGTGNTNVTRVGESIGSLYGLKSLSVNPDNGQRIFLNRHGDQVQFNGLGAWTYLDGSPAAALSGDDFYLLGNALPKWYGGFANNFSYKGLELHLNFSYAGGHYVMNRTRSTLTDQIFFNSSTEILDRWTTPGQRTDVPRVVVGDRISFGGSTPISEHVEKGDFLRLQNVLLAYNLPTGVLSAVRLSRVRLYGQVNNALLFTNYTGIDPEVSANGNSNVAPGVEYNTAGLGRTFTVGLNVSF